MILQKLTNADYKWLSAFDFGAIIISFIWPLYFFPSKSDLSVQIALGILFGLIALFTSIENRLTPFRDVLPILESAYGPALGAFNAFMSLALISFFNRSYEFSRYINIAALLSIAFFILVSRRYFFGAFEINRVEIEDVKAAYGQEVASSKLAISDKKSMVVLTIDAHHLAPKRFLILKDEPFTFLYSRIRFVGGQAAIELLQASELPVLSLRQRLTKRLFDIVGGLILGFLSMPIILIAALASFAIHLENPFYGQPRPGLGGVIFTIYKLKSFFGQPATISRWGAFLRRTNIDELPQFYNILRGDMSLVGPRAETLERASQMEDHHLTRNLLRPGLTGFWQISPYRGKPIRDRVEYDVYYLLCCSLMVDLIIIGLTPIYVFSNNREK